MNAKTTPLLAWLLLGCAVAAAGAAAADAPPSQGGDGCVHEAAFAARGRRHKHVPGRPFPGPGPNKRAKPAGRPIDGQEEYRRWLIATGHHPDPEHLSSPMDQEKHHLWVVATGVEKVVGDLVGKIRKWMRKRESRGAGFDPDGEEAGRARAYFREKLGRGVSFDPAALNRMRADGIDEKDVLDALTKTGSFYEKRTGELHRGKYVYWFRGDGPWRSDRIDIAFVFMKKLWIEVVQVRTPADPLP